MKTIKAIRSFYYSASLLPALRCCPQMFWSGSETYITWNHDDAVPLPDLQLRVSVLTCFHHGCLDGLCGTGVKQTDGEPSVTSSDCSVHAGQDSLVSSPKASHGIISEHVAAGNNFINLCRVRYKFITLEFSEEISCTEEQTASLCLSLDRQ